MEKPTAKPASSARRLLAVSEECDGGTQWRALRGHLESETIRVSLIDAATTKIVPLMADTKNTGGHLISRAGHQISGVIQVRYSPTTCQVLYNVGSLLMLMFEIVDNNLIWHKKSIKKIDVPREYREVRECQLRASPSMRCVNIITPFDDDLPLVNVDTALFVNVKLGGDRYAIVAGKTLDTIDTTDRDRNIINAESAYCGTVYYSSSPVALPCEIVSDAYYAVSLRRYAGDYRYYRRRRDVESLVFIPADDGYVDICECVHDLTTYSLDLVSYFGIRRVKHYGYTGTYTPVPYSPTYYYAASPTEYTNIYIRFALEWSGKWPVAKFCFEPNLAMLSPVNVIGMLTQRGEILRPFYKDNCVKIMRALPVDRALVQHLDFDTIPSNLPDGLFVHTLLKYRFNNVVFSVTLHGINDAEVIGRYCIRDDVKYIKSTDLTDKASSRNTQDYLVVLFDRAIVSFLEDSRTSWFPKRETIRLCLTTKDTPLVPYTDTRFAVIPRDIVRYINTFQDFSVFWDVT